MEGKIKEYLDIVDEEGNPTGKTVDRELAHKDGILHRTAHVWVVRKSTDGYEILLQKRSMEKDSFPGLYGEPDNTAPVDEDTTSGGKKSGAKTMLIVGGVVVVAGVLMNVFM